MKETWPGCTQMEQFINFKEFFHLGAFPRWAPTNLSREFPRLDHNGVDLLHVSIYFIIINYKSKL